MANFKIEEIKKKNGEFIKIVEEESDQLTNPVISSEDKMARVASLIIQKNTENQTIMKEGFVGLAVQSSEFSEKMMKANEASLPKSGPNSSTLIT